METLNDVLNFCNEFTFYDLKGIASVIELNQARDCLINFFSVGECVKIDSLMKVLGIIDDTSIMNLTDDSTSFLHITTILIEELYTYSLLKKYLKKKKLIKQFLKNLL